VGETRTREYGRVRLNVDEAELILAHVPSPTSAWMSHGDIVDRLSDDFVAMASTDSCPYAAVRHTARPMFGLQFHPEVTHTLQGERLIERFVREICGCEARWEPGNIAVDAIARVRGQVGGDRVSVTTIVGPDGDGEEVLDALSAIGLQTPHSTPFAGVGCIEHLLCE